MATSHWLSFSDEEAGAALREWWSGVKKDRGARAELRRCGSPADVALCSAYHQLRYKLSKLGTTDWERLAAVAGVLAHVEHDLHGSRFACQMAAGNEEKGGSRARVSELRFRRLLKNDSAAELFEPLRRVVMMLDRKASITALAQDLYGWSPHVRRRWAEDYYQNASLRSD